MPRIVVPPMAAQEQEVVFHLVFQRVAYKINVTRYAAQTSSHQTVIIVAGLHLFAHKAVGREHAVYTAALREPNVLGYKQPSLNLLPVWQARKDSGNTDSGCKPQMARG